MSKEVEISHDVAASHQPSEVGSESDKDNSALTARKVDVLEVTHGRPYKQINFIGTYVAVCLGALACYGGFIMPATSLALINADIGPSANYYWVILAWTLCLAVGYTLVGRLSDIFGRRWFFIGASVLATVGCIIGATAQNINTLIGANVLIGFATAAQLSFNYILTELVPVKDRFYVLAIIFLCAAPFSCFGPYIARLLIVHTTAGWRWEFRMNIIVNGLSTLLYFIFYHPPNFEELHKHRSKWQEVKDIDFGGIILFSGGMILFLMGLSWGGILYPWASAHVIATLVVGFVTCVAFVLYECYMPLNRPLIPMHLFRNRDYVVFTIVSAVGGMLYYSLNVLYPTMVAALFTTNIVRAGLLSCAIGGGVAAGQFGASVYAVPGGNMRWKLFFAVCGCTAFTAALAGAKKEATATALAVVSAFFIGSLESLAGVAVTIVIKDQTEIGAAVGAYGSVRSIAGVLATAIFSTILTNKITDYTKAIVVPALAKAGLPLTSIEPLLLALASGSETAIAQVPGVTPQILEVAAVTLKEAYFKAFQVVYLVTIAFGVLSCVAAFFTPAIEKYYTNDVMRRLHLPGGKKWAEKNETEKAVVEHSEHV